MAADPVKPREPLYQERLRPQFHITARYWDAYQLNPPIHHEGWLNDMNGLVYNQGEYHFFAQRWWSAWLHAISTDLIHWEELPPAFGKGGPFGGTQSGGGVVDTDNCSGLGDGKEPPMLAFWSSTDNLNQCMSYSRDRGRTWTKYEKNPVLVHAFRDPNVFWHEPTRKWIMILYGHSKTGSREVLSYGMNGEGVDAHTLRGFKVGEWTCSAIRVFEDGRVVATDPKGQSATKINSRWHNIAAAAFRVGAKTDGTEFLDGDIAEILVYDRSLSDVETTNAIAGLQARWKLADGKAEDGIPAEGLVLRLDAGAAGAGGNGAIELWKDLSGKGNDMKQADPARRPERVADGPGGRAVARFAGRQFLEGPAVLAAGDDSFSMVALWKRRHGGDSEVVCEQNSADKRVGLRGALLTASRIEYTDNYYLLFASTNLLEWTQLDAAIPDMYECPDMFELPVEPDPGATGGAAAKETKWVVVDGAGNYVLGRFDGNAFTVETKKLRGDYGRNFYATMTFDNMPKSDPRRIQMAWMRSNDYPKDMPFNQQASFPCELTLHRLPKGIVMFRYPAREIAGIHGKAFTLADRLLKPGEDPLSGLKGDLYDVDLTIDASRSTGSKLVFMLRGHTVSYDLKKGELSSVGCGVLMAPQSGKVKVRILLDRLSIETFGNDGEVSMTNMIIPVPEAASLSLQAQGGDVFIESLKVHEVESTWKKKTEEKK